MASLTIRKLDEAIKAYLRLRSASNGRSVEEEVRVILRETIAGPSLRVRHDAIARRIAARASARRAHPAAHRMRPVRPASP